MEEKRSLIQFLLVENMEKKMILEIDGEKTPQKERVTLKLVRGNGGAVYLNMKKGGNPDQNVLVFHLNGAVTKLSTFTDIGFQVDADGKLIIK